MSQMHSALFEIFIGINIVICKIRLTIILLGSCNSWIFDTEKETTLLNVMVFSNNVEFNIILNSSYFLTDDPIYIINCTVQKNYCWYISDIQHFVTIDWENFPGKFLEIVLRFIFEWAFYAYSSRKCSYSYLLRKKSHEMINLYPVYLCGMI